KPQVTSLRFPLTTCGNDVAYFVYRSSRVFRHCRGFLSAIFRFVRTKIPANDMREWRGVFCV
ncbi:hypothetical protein AB4343_13945, partial [Vibrio breoganii]